MTINYTKNDYSKFENYSNVFYEWPKEGIGHPSTWTVRLMDKMRPLVHKIAMNHPDWTLVLHGGSNDSSSKIKAHVYRIRVLCEGEEIGEIGIDTWKHDSPYSISCNKIANSRARGRNAWTTKVDRAYKLVKENFAPLDTVVKVQRLANKLGSVVSNAAWGKTRAFNDTMGKLAEPLAAYIANNLTAIMAAPEMRASDMPLLEAIPAMLNDHKLTDDIRNSFGVTGHIIVTEKDYYLVHNPQTKEITKLTASQLSDDVSSKLGLLKAFDTDDQIIEGVGVRTDGNAYYIL